MQLVFRVQDIVTLLNIFIVFTKRMTEFMNDWTEMDSIAFHCTKCKSLDQWIFVNARETAMEKADENGGTDHHHYLKL